MVDNSGGVNDGVLYVTSMNADQPTIVSPPYHPYLVVSLDAGNSFSTPRYLDTLNYASGSIITKPMPTPAVGADGTLYAIYPSYVISQNALPQYIIASSNDGGISLQHNVTHQVTSGLSAELAKKAPLLIADQNNAAHLAYIFLKETNGDLDVFYSESFDFGINWSNEIRVNDDPIGNGVLQDLIWANFNESSDVAVCWRDRRNGGSGYEVPTEIMGAVKFSDSIDFSANFTISDQQVVHDTILERPGNDFQSIQFSEDSLHVVWGDTRSGILNIYYTKMNVVDQTANIQNIAQSDWNFSMIYPNPARGLVNFDAEFSGYKFQLVDAQGRLVKSGRLPESASLEVIDLEKGWYAIYLSKGQNMATFKLVKE